MSTELYEYYHTLDKNEKDKLPKRWDPEIPSALELHMKVNKQYKYTEEERKIQKAVEKGYNDQMLAIMKKNK